MCLDPRTIPRNKITEAAALTKSKRWSTHVPLAELPRLDAIVCGSVAVTRTGRRCGKGEGYSDLEYGLLRELGHPPIPIATTVHDIQIVESLPWERTDLPLSIIVTPTQTIRVGRRLPAPDGIDWSRLTKEDLASMPVLEELRQLRTPKRSRR